MLKHYAFSDHFAGDYRLTGWGSTEAGRAHGNADSQLTLAELPDTPDLASMRYFLDEQQALDTGPREH